MNTQNLFHICCEYTHCVVRILLGILQLLAAQTQFAHVMEISTTLENRLRILEHTVLSLQVSMRPNETNQVATTTIL